MNRPRKKSFIKIPRYTGGKELLRKFIDENLKYPQEALDNEIEGDVILSYSVNSKGEVIDVEIEKGIGYGCDEEAVRLLHLLKHDTVKNKGVRVTTSSRIKIPFRIKRDNKDVIINIEYKRTSKTKVKIEGNETGNSKKVYNYTIGLE